MLRLGALHSLTWCNVTALKWEVKFRLVGFTTGLYAVVIAMLGTFVPQHLSWYNNTKHLKWCTWRNCCCPGNMNSKSKWESKLLWQYYRIKFPTQSLQSVENNVCSWPFHVRTWECICLWCPSKVSKLSTLWHGNLGSVRLTSWIYSKERYSDTKQSAGSHIRSFWLLCHYIRGDPACVPLYLSKATTRKSHRTCSMWWTCVNAMTMYGHARVPMEIDGAQDRGAYGLPRSSYRMDRSTCGWDGGTPPSSPSSWRL